MLLKRINLGSMNAFFEHFDVKNIGIFWLMNSGCIAAIKEFTFIHNQFKIEKF